MCQLQMTYLRGVLGLPMIRRGERIFGSNENLSLMFSSTDGATYVNPYKNKDIGDTTEARLVSAHRWEAGRGKSKNKEEMIDWPGSGAAARIQI